MGWQDDEKRTPLHLACAANRLDAVRFLLENGADVNALNHSYNTPMDFAVQPAIINLLRRYGGVDGYTQVRRLQSQGKLPRDLRWKPAENSASPRDTTTAPTGGQ
jgi:ankyrin repeat protein